MAKIQFENKVALNENASIPDVNKCKATDMNEIKSVVNENDDLIGNLSSLNTTEKSNLVGAINEVYQNNVYSTDETVIGTWFGEKLYRKTYEISSPVSGDRNIDHNISNLKQIILATGNMITKDNRFQYIPRSVPSNTIYDLNIGDITTTTFSLQIGSGYVSSLAPKKVFVVLEYLKTTD